MVGFWLLGPTFLAFVRMKLRGVEGSEEGEGSEVDGGPESSDGSQGHDIVQESIILDTDNAEETEEAISYIYPANDDVRTLVHESIIGS